MRTAYVNGRYRAVSDQAITLQDRGFQFADGVYEVILVVGGRMIDAEQHLDRLDRSLREISLPLDRSRASLRIVMGEVLRRNRVSDGMLYIQVTRGAAERNLAFPQGARPTVVVTARPLNLNDGQPLRGIRVVTAPDTRWARVDIKSVALLPNLLAKQKAIESGFDDVWFTDRDGCVTEASGANAWIVTKNRELVTRPLSNAILHGITRVTAISLASTMKFKFSERSFTVAEAEDAIEAFITSATALVTPVSQVNRAKIGDGGIGPFTRELCTRYRDYCYGRT